MDTKTMDKAEIAQQLRTMLEEQLFGDKPWPIDNNDEVHRKLVEWGLIEYVNETDFHASALGVELSVDYWTMFMGHHELAEIPDMLVECGLLTREEADHIIFDRWERDDEKLEDILPPILRRAYLDQVQAWRGEGRAEGVAAAMHPELLDDVRRLVDAVRGFLSNDDGNDDEYIMLMGQYVEEVERSSQARIGGCPGVPWPWTTKRNGN